MPEATRTLTVELPPDLWDVLERMGENKTESVRAWLREMQKELSNGTDR